MAKGAGGRKRVLWTQNLRKIFREVLGPWLLLLLVVSLYLRVFRRTQGGSSFDPLGFLSEKAARIYGARLCRKFTLEGLRFANYDRLEKYVERYCFGGDLTLVELRNALLEDPWISRLYLHKIIPDRLNVLVIERSPFALFSSDQRSYILVDEFGERINIPEEEILNFSHLFLVVDDNFDSEEIGRMFNRLSTYGNLARRVSTLSRRGNRRWDLRLRNNVLVKMPEEGDQTAGAWTVLSDLLDIYGLDRDLEEIDLRVERKIFLKYRSGTREEISKFSKNSVR
jgi:hypothetical protein